MFLRSVVLGSTVIVAFAATLVDDADIKVRGATLEPIEECPATTSRTFHHDGMQKEKRAEATFHFDPPRDGCYLIEQRTELDGIAWNTPDQKKCEASANTKVHVHYSKAMQAVGTVDQTPKGFGRQPQDQWTFIAGLQFFAGQPGNVTLSNEGTEPGTLTVFDQVRFSWSGKDCIETHAQPRRVEIRMTVDFELIADRLNVFGIAFKQRLAEMAGIPENALRLTSLRTGDRSGIRIFSVIAEFLVLPIVVDPLLTSGHDVTSAMHSIKMLGVALSVTKNTAELCVLSGATLRDCDTEIKDLGYAMPTVEALPMQTIKASPAPVVEQGIQQQQESDTQTDETADGSNMIVVVSAAAAAGLLVCLGLAVALRRQKPWMDWVYKAPPVKTKKTKKTKIADRSKAQSYETKVEVVDITMEQEVSGMPVEEKEPVEQDDDKSTVCPSMSDQQSESCGDIENGYAHPYQTTKA